MPSSKKGFRHYFFLKVREDIVMTGDRKGKLDLEMSIDKIQGRKVERKSVRCFPQQELITCWHFVAFNRLT